MPQVKIESVKRKIEKEESSFLNDSTISEEVKDNYKSLDDSETSLRKKYVYLSQWNAKKNKMNSDIDKGIDVTEIRTIFKELKTAIDSSDKKTTELIYKELEILKAYIDTTEQRKLERYKNELLKQKELIEKRLAELEGTTNL
ncbi:MAG: hypothetical protein EZS26_002757 [Candidatus Ordinivivax streblomastigis]|uniref:Uncharacterized protein n=1 Tax=Candidatus Ordinivivax streblomastigis TaxID=2540710 RepID=A0A5M8NYQ7_9BACT|nr:MAG: hypothetical protein EZS26_002757 [Candidatus Ordinivivax streblomastigis]